MDPCFIVFHSVWAGTGDTALGAGRWVSVTRAALELGQRGGGRGGRRRRCLQAASAPGWAVWLPHALVAAPGVVRSPAVLAAAAPGAREPSGGCIPFYGAGTDPGPLHGLWGPAESESGSPTPRLRISRLE